MQRVLSIDCGAKRGTDIKKTDIEKNYNSGFQNNTHSIIPTDCKLNKNPRRALDQFKTKIEPKLKTK